MPQGHIWLTDAEVAAIRRELLTVQRQIERLRALDDGVQIAERLETVAIGIEYLLERAEERRGVH